MQVERYENVLFNTNPNPFSATEKADTSKSEKSGKAEPKQADKLESSIAKQYATVIEKSLQTEEIDYQAVRQAQNELNTGQLDDLEMSLIAAENILALGI